MPGVLIKGVPYQGEVVDITLHERKVMVLPAGQSAEYEVIDGTGMVAVPSFHDDHVHFRDPGLTEKEDLLTGARAAAAGGYCMVRCMPNTRPVMDSVEAMEAFYAERNRLQIPITVVTAAALTLGEAGTELCDIEALATSDLLTTTFTDDGEPTISPELLVEALRRIHAIGDYINIALHCEETPRSSARVRAALGDGPAMVREPELIRLAIAALAEAGVGNIHIQHVSLAESARLIADAKAKGLAVTAEVAPHHLLLCEDDIPLRGGEPDPNWKMNPPLRSHADMLAMRQALAEGVIDVIATDHAPHTTAEKAKPWDEAPFGVIGLETAFGAVMSLVHAGELTFERLMQAMANGQESLGFGITLIDPNAVWTVDPEMFYSKSRNCPFAGMTFKGKPVYTIAGGNVVMAEGEVLF